MKILREIIWDNMRKNKRSSFAIMIALFLMTTLMSCFSGMVYTMWTDAVALEKWHNGNWHGELFDETYGRDLEKIKNYASVDAVLLKGPWEVAKLPEEGRRIYVISRGANREYWESMPEKDGILRGRVPETEQELVLSKQYFDDHPDTNIGDMLTLPVGTRMQNGQVCMPTEGIDETEDFLQTGKENAISVSVGDGRWPDKAAIEAMKEIPGLKPPVIETTLPCAIWVPEEKASKDLQTYLGGFQGIVEMGKYSPIERGGKYRIQVELMGLEKDSFLAYCEDLGVDPQPYYQDASRALVYNKTKDPKASTKRATVMRELLDLEQGELLTFTEKNDDAIEGDFQFSIQAYEFADHLPEELSNPSFYSSFTLLAVMPMEHVQALGASCCEKRQGTVKRFQAFYNLEETGEISNTDIDEAKKKVEEVVNQYYGSGDFNIGSLSDQEKMTADIRHAMNLIFAFLTCFLAVIGLSNIWATISANLRQRRREFAMLKSVGLTPGQLWKMLCLEGVTLGLGPLFYTIPFQAVWIGAFLYTSQITVLEYLPFFPVRVLSIYILLVLLAILGAYLIGGRKLQRESVIEAVKDDTI